jgi:hypothetical protein
MNSIKMTHELIKKLPKEIVDIIKLYTGEGCWRNGKYINIHRIPKNDIRYEMLKKRPRIKQIPYNNVGQSYCGTTWFKLDNGKFIVIRVGEMTISTLFGRVTGHFREMYYNKEKSVFNLS